MLGKTHTRVRDEIEQDFPHLPLGCSIVLEKVAKEIILINLSNQNRGGLISMLRQIKSFISDYDVEPTLANFLELTENNLHAIYSTEYLWFELIAKAKGAEVERNENYKILAKCLKNALFSCESSSYFNQIKKFIEGDFPIPNDSRIESFYLMFYADLFGEIKGTKNFNELADTLRLFFCDKRLSKEIMEFLDFKNSVIEGLEKTIPLPFQSVLHLHGRYTRSQILYGLGRNSELKAKSSREGVFRDAINNFEILFVTLNKEESGFHSSISYEDYFINSELFHWQTQNSTSPETKTGKSYIEQKQNKRSFLLFVREKRIDEHGVTMGFQFVGPLTYLYHEGSKPMSITWKLQYEPPASLLNEGLKLAV